MTEKTHIRATTPPGRAPQTDPKEGARKAGSEAQRLAGEARDAARSTLHDAKAAAEDRTEAAKGQAADEIARTARGLEAAADQLADAPLQRELLHEAADGLQQIARAVQGKSLGALVEDLADFGRRNPVAYLGGAALAGFTLARFARASAPTDAGDQGEHRADRSAGYGTSGSADYAGSSAYPAGQGRAGDYAGLSAGRGTAADPSSSPQTAADPVGGGTTTSPQSAADLSGESRDG